MKIIDPHLHLFNLAEGDYHWLKPENSPFWPDKALINKNFIEQDLSLQKPLELAGFVHIEAGYNNLKPWREIEWLEQHCKKPFRSIAYLNLSSPIKQFEQNILKLKEFPSVHGIRDILDENALAILNQSQITENFALLTKYQLSFELQMSLSDLKAVHQLLALLEKQPDFRVQINHAGWPPSSNQTMAFKLWQQGLNLLSKFPNCTIKCSGWEMTERNYQINWQQHVIHQCLKTFGEGRVMLASNFPLTLFSNDYQSYWQSQTNCDINDKLLNEICYKNSKKHYYFFQNTKHK